MFAKRLSLVLAKMFAQSQVKVLANSVESKRCMKSKRQWPPCEGKKVFEWERDSQEQPTQ
jgi:hypothetical protein